MLASSSIHVDPQHSGKNQQEWHKSEDDVDTDVECTEVVHGTGAVSGV